MKSIARTSGNIDAAAVAEIAGALQQLLADVFTLYVKTKSFHWHIGGPHFRDYHVLLDDQAEQIFAMTDAVAERARKLGATTLRSVGDIVRHRRLHDNESTGLTATEMLSELRADNQLLTGLLRTAHSLCDRYNDVASASLIEIWIDEAERRTWFLSEAAGDGIRV